MNAEQQYRLSDAARQKRFDELLSRTNPSDLRQELAACRLTLETLLAEPSPSPGLISSLLTVAGKLAAAHQLIQERAGETIGREEMGQLVKGVMGAIADNLQDLPDFNDRMDRIVAAIANLRRPEPTAKLLTFEESGT